MACRTKRLTLFPICRKSMTTRKEGRVKRNSQVHSFHFTAVSACNGEIAPESVSLSVRPSECPFLPAPLSLLYRNNRAFATPPYLISIYPSPSSASVTILLVSNLPTDNARAGRPAIACVRGGQVGELEFELDMGKKKRRSLARSFLSDHSAVSNRAGRTEENLHPLKY